MSPTKSPPWRREEIILALELYLKGGRRIPEDDDPEVLVLSEDLNRLPLIPPEQRAPSFRNPNGVVLKISNLRSFDPHATSKGMSAGSRLDKELMEAFADDPVGLALEARAVRLEYHEWLEPERLPVREPTPFPQPSQLPFAAESSRLWGTGFDPFALHLMLEQDMEAQNERRDSSPSLTCAVCGFDFGRTYGELGEGYIQFHHRVPLTELAAGTRPSSDDLTLLCANCHAMLHRDGQGITIEQLRNAIRETQRAAIRSLNDRLNSGDR